MIIYLTAVALFFVFIYLCYRHSETERSEVENAIKKAKNKYAVKLYNLYSNWNSIIKTILSLKRISLLLQSSNQRVDQLLCPWL